MTPPLDFAVDDNSDSADMGTREQRAPEVARFYRGAIGLDVRYRHAVDAQTAQVHHGFGENRKMRRDDAMRSGYKTLRLRDGELVVDPSMVRVERPCLAVFGGDGHVVGTWGVAEELDTPGVALKNRHRVRGCGWRWISQAIIAGGLL